MNFIKNFRRIRAILITWPQSYFAAKLIKKYKPIIIGVTGSTGKTTTKYFVNEILKHKYSTIKTPGNDNFYGVFSTVLGIDPVHSLLGLILSLPKIIRQTFIENEDYPEILIIEYGTSSQGTLNYLTSKITPTLSIITNVGKAHLRYFKNIKAVVKEKSELIKCLGKNNYALFNYDDDKVRSMNRDTKAKVFYYGFNIGADIRAEDIDVSLAGVKFKLVYKNQSNIILIPGINALSNIYSILAAVSVGLIYKMGFKEICNILPGLKTNRGRGNFIYGINDSILIDDGYNSNPKSCHDSLINFKDLGKGRYKIAVIGDMLELGNYSEKEHREIGKLAATIADAIICVGKSSEFIYKEALWHGFSENKLYWTINTLEASNILFNVIKNNSIILVKGSNKMNMLSIVDNYKNYK